MINLEYGISFIEGTEGLFYIEGPEFKVYLVTAFQQEQNNITHLLAVATSEASAAQGIMGILEEGYEVIATKGLHEMLEMLKETFDETHQL